MNYAIKPKTYQGIIHIPPSKSDSQRAILIAALANRTSVLINVGSSNDEMAMLANAEKLGAVITRIDEKTLSVAGNFDQTIVSELNCGESGLGARLLTPVATLKTQPVTLTGEGSLVRRDQTFFERFLPQMGVNVQLTNEKLPIRVSGPLKPGTYSVDGSESSQYISGLLIAFSQTEGTTLLQVENSTSKPYIDMTLHTLKSFGVHIEEEEKEIYKITGKQPITEASYTIDGDWSSASYWLTAAALGMKISVQGLSLSSKQADKAILNAFMLAGCRILNTENGLKIDGTDRKPLDFNATDCPDLFPALTTYAALTPGLSRIKGVHRLANKESNRGKALQQEFTKLGVAIRVEEDTMFIEGVETLLPAVVSSHNDHRIAMCLAIASIAGRVELTIEQADAVGKSYPGFWEDLEALVC
ncbi:3-phosphoshikimate 1-carboxyvinyltransferase [Crocinitomicaceae bacterium CZZ-1]|uniref:3-phosphoshikimate 1-carboxyvinyltransferase n=1 Tax=Taishania pollutisoli TaxID=2766479 RepID=A0A8J6U254_9FLAO|nr:3-phosphoshikimate 1-carboxyvinyltransferase [Taishania pollutisoli]MBC9812175.1 3-phosphoshikimate 1-carboxyvinyltransferase [Taishania pollutisoli]